MDLERAHIQLAETLPVRQVDAWGHIVQRDRAIVDALANGDETTRRVMLGQLTKIHEAMWQTLQTMRR
jgi:hypothetical protein